MHRRDVTAALTGLAWMGWAGHAAAGLAEGDAAAGVRAALRGSAEAAVSSLGRVDGFLGNSRVRIDVPASLQDTARWLHRIGQGRKVDELITAMNRAAELAVPEARELFLRTIESISIEDALRLVRGGPSAATDFFAAKTRGMLAERFLPIVTRAMDKVELVQRYEAVAARASGLGLFKRQDQTIAQYVTERALDGLFLTMGEQERRIRADPVGTGIGAVRKAFGA